MIRSEWLEAFVEFGERLNFTHAARALHLSQPALHLQISKLAEQLGVALYLKRGRQILLTDAGRRLLSFARESRERDDQLLAELRGEPQRRPVTLAAGAGAYLYLLGGGIREHLRRSPARLRLLQRDRAGALEAVRSGEAHLGVAALDTIPDGVTTHLLQRVPQVLVMPRRHRLAHKRQIRLRDLRGEPLVVPPAGQPQRATLAQAFASAEVPLEVAVEASGWDLVLRFVELGVGLTVVNGCCTIPRGLVARPIAELPRVSYYIFSRAGARLSDETMDLCDRLLAAGYHPRA